MSKLKIGDVAPEFTLLNDKNEEISLKDFEGKHVILYFYPKDNTPGCTIEAIGFTEIISEFQKLDAEVIGVSPDDPESHARFIEDKNLKVTLLSDQDKIVSKAYNSWGETEYNGKIYPSVIRSTYLIDPKGIIQYIWHKVRVRTHPEEVKNILLKLKKSIQISM